ncbi:MAG: hypothetical protein V4724_34920 [Pseudomonadota bacterium]
MEGTLDLPSRADYIPREGAGKPAMVDSTSHLDFETISVAYKDCDVLIGPFVWDWVQLTIRGLPEQEAASVAKNWFFRWFDPEDTNEANEDGLYGVVHFLGEPKVAANGIEFSIDLGSAPPEALEDLLERMSSHGASAASVANSALQPTPAARLNLNR